MHIRIIPKPTTTPEQDARKRGDIAFGASNFGLNSRRSADLAQGMRVRANHVQARYLSWYVSPTHVVVCYR